MGEILKLSKKVGADKVTRYYKVVSTSKNPKGMKKVIITKEKYKELLPKYGKKKLPTKKPTDKKKKKVAAKKKAAPKKKPAAFGWL